MMLLVASAASLLVACSSEDTEAASVYAACTRTSGCQAGLSCIGGVCTPPEARTEGGTEAGLVDARGDVQ